MRNSFAHDAMGALKLAEIASAYHDFPPKVAKCLGCGTATLCRTTNVGPVCKSCVSNDTCSRGFWRSLIIVTSSSGFTIPSSA